MPDAVIVAAVRTPIGKRNGALSGIHPTDLSALVLNELVARTGIDPAEVDDVQWGCVTQLGDQSSNVGRFAVLAAGWPESVPAVTVNRACGSSQQALDHAAFAVMSGQQELVVAGGVETMSRVPLGAARATGEPYGATALKRYGVSDFNQIDGAELMAGRRRLSRRRLDEYSARSHERAAAAVDAGAFTEQIVPVPTGDGVVDADEGIRRGTTADTLARLRPVAHEDGVVHAGNASQISDGAAALLVTTPERAAALGLHPIVRYHSGAVCGADPVTVLEGPMPATQKVLERSGVALHDIGAYEVNEAFATVPLAWLHDLEADEDRLNPLGGAIALGHPLGASGAVLMVRLVHHMRDRAIRYGLQTMCETGGTANATIVELVSGFDLDQQDDSMTGPRPLSQDERSEAARRAIVDAAIDVLADEGYRRTTFTRIQKAAGMSRGLISYHFGSKGKLIESVVTSVRDTYHAQAIEVPRVDQGTGLHAVLGMIDSYLQRLTSNSKPASVMLVLAMSADADEPDVREAVRRRYAEMRTELQGWLDRGLADGSVHPSVDPAACAGVLEGIVRGIALQYVVDREGFDLAGSRRAALAMVRSALGGHPHAANDVDG